MPPTTATLTQQVYDRLRRQLANGELEPRTRLVNRTLARELGTSTIPVREALNRLVSEGLVELVPGAGAFVRQPDCTELAQLYDLREALEPLAAAEATRRATAAELDELRTLCNRGSDLARHIGPAHASRTQWDQWLDLEEQFHALLATTARNRWLSKVLTEVRLVAAVFAAQRSEPDILTPALARQTCREHAALVHALQARDAEQARTRMAAHIRHGREVILNYFASSGPSVPNRAQAAHT